jgi:D-alanyl-D-alanine carboxypeptidase/D-alanyl-D-alanine-endopeptidase (penicillin-binding protein 4)
MQLETFTRILALALLGAFSVARATPQDLAALPAPVQNAMRTGSLPAGGLSVWVQSVDSDEPMLAFNETVPRNPASVMKLVTTLVGLQALGPDFRWQTRAYVSGRRDAETLDGDLYIEGGGDPYLVTESVWKFLRGLRDGGLRHVRGDLVVDASYFDVGEHDPAAFDGKPHRAYNARPSALLVNFNATRFSFRPEVDRGQVAISLDPPSALRLDNRLELTNGRCAGALRRVRMQVLGAPRDLQIRFSGRYPAACGQFSLHRSVGDPVGNSHGVIRSLWGELGGTIEGADREARIPDAADPVLTWRSRPLAEAIRGMNKFSNNVMTRQLLLTLGAEGREAPGTVEKGRDVVGQWLDDNGVDTGGLYVDNGAGLSRDSRVSARTLGQMLRLAWTSPLMPEYVSSLPLSAVDGTLRRRFNGAPLAGRMHMKTGLLDDVRAIGGYLVSRSGRVMAVVVLHNHPGVHNGPGTGVQDALLDWVFENA